MQKISYKKLHNLQTRLLRQGVRLVSTLESADHFEEELEKFEDLTTKLNDLIGETTLDDLGLTKEEKIVVLRQSKVLFALFSLFE